MQIKINEDISLVFSKEILSPKEAIAIAEISKKIMQVFGEETNKTGKTKLTDEIIKDVMSRLKKGEKANSIAKSYGKSDAWIYSVKTKVKKNAKA